MEVTLFLAVQDKQSVAVAVAVQVVMAHFRRRIITPTIVSTKTSNKAKQLFMTLHKT